MRRVTTAIAGVAIALAPGVARAAEPASPLSDAPARYAAGTVALKLAEQIAVTHWGTAPCGGNVSVSWGPMAEGVNAESVWSNPTSIYDNAQQNFACSIRFNTNAPFDWQKFCTTTIHEIGHLAGRQHSSDAASVMYPEYGAPDPACVAAADPSGSPAPAPAATARSAPTAQIAASRATSKTGKRHTRKRRGRGRNRRSTAVHRFRQHSHSHGHAPASWLFS